MTSLSRGVSPKSRATAAQCRLEAVRGRAGVTVLFAYVVAVLCLPLGGRAAAARASLAALGVPLAPRQLRYGALGQHEERHHDQAQDGRHGHHVGLQVAACHQCIDDVARRVAERHAAEHEGHAQPEDVQGVLVAPARGVNEQHPGEDVEETRSPR